MIDQRYFEDVLPQQVNRMDGTPVIEVCLVDGQRYYIHLVQRVERGYVWLQVYPPDHVPVRVKEPATVQLLAAGRSGFNTDEVAIPYEAIAQVRVTEEVPGWERELGFRGRVA